ncbi:unnamed protein product [Coffea canephora]|uniref:Cytochrome P450 n=1 Tax=Coffea canephora TaxID=49390 RepID=A0A068UYS6_COFCA|nr:unnamed protein product [Coffea canephora]
MEAPTLMVLLSSFSALLASLCILKLVYSLWWRPKLIERELKQQGIGGTSYNFPYGDKLATKKLMLEAWSIPMSLNHEIIPRANPFLHQMVQTYGKVCLSWNGTMPRLILGKAELVRLILNNKNGHFQKTPLANLLTLGLSTLEGEKWAKHRRIITPAFHHEKLQKTGNGTGNFLQVDGWKKSVPSDGSSEIDINPEVQSHFADVIARTAFGRSYREGKKIIELRGILPPRFQISSKKNRRRYELDAQIKAMLRDVTCKKQKATQKGESRNGDLLGLLLQCKEQQGSDGNRRCNRGVQAVLLCWPRNHS